MALPDGAALAQFTPVPSVPYYAINPGAPLNLRADSPAQQQVIQNYRTQLQQTQREQLMQNPSGLGRDQLDVNRQLNAVGPGPVGPGALVAPSIGSVPGVGLGVGSTAAPGGAPIR